MTKKLLFLLPALLLAASSCLAETVSILFPAGEAFYRSAAQMVQEKLSEKGLDSAIIYYASEDAIVYDGSDVFVICAKHFPDALSEDAYTVAFLCESEKADKEIVMDEYLTGAALMKMVLSEYNGRNFALEYVFSEDNRMFYLGARDVLQPYINRVTASVLCGEGKKGNIAKQVKAIELAHSEDHLPLTIFCDSDSTIRAVATRFDGEAYYPSRKDVWQYDLENLTQETANAVSALLLGETGERRIVLEPSALMGVPETEE